MQINHVRTVHRALLGEDAQDLSTSKERHARALLPRAGFTYPLRGISGPLEFPAAGWFCASKVYETHGHPASSAPQRSSIASLHRATGGRSPCWPSAHLAFRWAHAAEYQRDGQRRHQQTGQIGDYHFSVGDCPSKDPAAKWTEQTQQLLPNHPDNDTEQYRKMKLKDFRLESYRLEGNYISEPLQGVNSNEWEAAAGA